MAKTESTFINMTATLVVVTLVAAGLLGTVFALTKEPIRLAELAKKNEAIAVVVPGFDCKNGRRRSGNCRRDFH